MTTGSKTPRRTGHTRRRSQVWKVLVLWMLAMAPLLRWGLPTSRHDDLLFGGPSWEAEQYAVDEALAALRARDAGADTDLNALEPSAELINLTADHAGRAEILQRYRLYSRQPDEMITFRALQRMDPRRFDFDPKLYQYGGGYIYLVAAALVTTAMLGITQLSGDIGIYLQSPELFARFYVVARCISLVFGALMLLAVYKLATRAAGRGAGWVALILCAATPVFISDALEAKPHLPSACMALWAAWFALRYHDRMRRRDAVLLGLTAGYAAALVLTGVVVAASWPLLLIALWKRCTHGSDRSRLFVDLAISVAIAVGVYAAANPYVIANLLAGGALGSNMANSTAMYNIGQIPAGLATVTRLLLEAGGLGLLLAGLAGFIILVYRHGWQTLIAASGGAVLLLICVLLGAGKPAEFARFLLLPTALLTVASAGLLAMLARRSVIATLLVTLLIGGSLRTSAYVHSFIADAGVTGESRYLAAQYLSAAVPADATIGVVQVPAPYSVPPLDFAHRRIVLVPSGDMSPETRGELPEWLVLTADDATRHQAAPWRDSYELTRQFAAAEHQRSPITWANKPVFVYKLKNSQ